MPVQTRGTIRIRAVDENASIVEAPLFLLHGFTCSITIPEELEYFGLPTLDDVVIGYLEECNEIGSSAYRSLLALGASPEAAAAVLPQTVFVHATCESGVAAVIGKLHGVTDE